MYYLGIDHHKKFSQVAVMDEKGEIHMNGKIAKKMSSIYFAYKVSQRAD